MGDEIDVFDWTGVDPDLEAADDALTMADLDAFEHVAKEVADQVPLDDLWLQFAGLSKGDRVGHVFHGNQFTRGREGGGGSATEHAQDIGRYSINAIAEKGGITIKLGSGFEPKNGYVVAIPGHEEVLGTVAQCTPEVVASYVSKHRSAIEKKGNYLGGWIDEGKVYLDVSTRMKDESKAIKFGMSSDQIAITKLHNGEPDFIYLRGPQADEHRIAEAMAKSADGPIRFFLRPGMSPEDIAAEIRKLAGVVTKMDRIVLEKVERHDDGPPCIDCIEKANSGAMVAFRIEGPQAEYLTLEGDVDECHMTIVYLGKAADINPQQRADLLLGLQEVGAAFEPMHAEVSGIARFTNTGSEDGDAVVALVDGVDLVGLYTNVRTVAEEGAGIELPNTHGFTPHITMAYIDPSEPMPLDSIDPMTLRFVSMILVLGDVHYEIPLTGTGVVKGDYSGHPFRGNQYERVASFGGRKSKGEELTRLREALIAGKRVVLANEHEASMLVDELARYAQDCQARGEKAKDFDLCKITVPKTNLFCSANLGIPRDRMPQFSGQTVPGSKASKLEHDKDGEVNGTGEFAKYLAGRGIKVTDKGVPASHLKATQTQLVGPKVAGMMVAMEKGTMKDGAIFVSRDGYVLDGHHRWAATVGRGLHEAQDSAAYKVQVRMVDMDIEDLLPLSIKWSDEFGIARKAGKQKGGG